MSFGFRQTIFSSAVMMRLTLILDDGTTVRTGRRPIVFAAVGGAAPPEVRVVAGDGPLAPRDALSWVVHVVPATYGLIERRLDLC